MLSLTTFTPKDEGEVGGGEILINSCLQSLEAIEIFLQNLRRKENLVNCNNNKLVTVNF